MRHAQALIRKYWFAGAIALLPLALGSTVHAQPDRKWGLLANPGPWAGQPVKGVYFFPGEGACRPSSLEFSPRRFLLNANIPTGAIWPCHIVVPGWYFNSGLYTYTPTDPRDLHWDDSAANRIWAVNQIASTHANVIVMSRWGHAVNNGAPMQGTVTSNDQVFEAVDSTGNILILPAIDTFTVGCRDFRTDFPATRDNPAPQLYAEVEDLVKRYLERYEWRRRWAQLYDQEGVPRYAINWIHAASTYNNDGCEFALGLDWIAAKIERVHRVRIGFTIDPFNAYQNNGVRNFNCDVGYCPSPYNSCLAQARSFLAIQGFNSEIVRAGDLALYDPRPPNPWAEFWSTPPRNINSERTAANTPAIDGVIAWKRRWIKAWIDTRVPVFLDVSPGYDARYVFKDAGGVIYGDNADEASDTWRNAQSALKGPGLKGTVYNAWNGYTEGLVATPGVWVKPQNVRSQAARPAGGLKAWLTDYFSVDPRLCHHVHYEDFGRIKHNVYGAICEKWQAMDAGLGALGQPVSSEMDGCNGRKRTLFEHGAIVFSGVAYAVYGRIGELYRDLDRDCGRLGAPTSDEKACERYCPGGRANDFENGHIYWCPDWTSARAAGGSSGC